MFFKIIICLIIVFKAQNEINIYQYLLILGLPFGKITLWVPFHTLLTGLLFISPAPSQQIAILHPQAQLHSSVKKNHKNTFQRRVVISESSNNILQENTQIIYMENQFCAHVTLADSRTPYKSTAFIQLHWLKTLSWNLDFQICLWVVWLQKKAKQTLS